MSILDKLATLVPMHEIEQGAQQQIYEVLKLECLKKLAVMPDVHCGYDLPIGGVALLDGYISPSFVGYDIGCGVCHVDLGITEIGGSLEGAYKKILEVIPTGFSEHQRAQDYEKEFTSQVLDKNTTNRVRAKVQSQLGTLGGGNHFIEVGFNQKGNICLTIHSGSRNVGHTIGGAYMKMGRVFALDSELGQAYLEDMNYALEWALANRLEMMKKIISTLNPWRNVNTILKDVINENHNHAVVTAEGVLHRKGATPADKDQLGLIPANMKQGVYVTKGLGNTDFLSSASHGCGRVLGRRKAKETLDYEKFKADMEGIVCSTARGILDEAPDAYKDANYVINAQKGIVVDIVDYIKPILNIKAQE